MKGDFFMFKGVLSLKKLSVFQLCAVAMLIAVTVVLSAVSGYLRIGNFGKISVSFISVYAAAAAFGPIIGGLVGALADIISCFVNPVGGYLWQLTLIEFVYGFIFGLFFFKRDNQSASAFKLWAKIVICVLLQFAANMTVKTGVLMSVGYAPSNFAAAFVLRLPSCLAASVLQLVVIGALEKVMPSVLKIIKRQA